MLFSLRQMRAARAQEAAGIGLKQRQGQRYKRQIALILGGGIRAKADGIAKVIGRRAGHHGIQINHAQRLHRRCVQDHVVQLGIVMRNAQGDFALSQCIHQPSGPRLARQGKINFTLNARRAAQRVALNRRVQRLKTARGIMKMRDGFTQQAGVKIAQLHLKLTESRAALLKIRRIARRLQAKAALHKLHQAIAIALIVAAKERAVSRRHQGEHMAVVQALAAQMAGDQINVSHQQLRIRKNGCIDALQDIIMRRISGYMIGRIDMPFAIGLTAQDTAFQVKGA